MYHRVHAPINAILSKTIEIPGKLFSVNGQSVHGIPNLFCRNERLVCNLQTEAGAVRLVMVGALIVASITTSWPGPSSPYRRRVERSPRGVQFNRAEEMARFTLGSTAIVLVPPSFGSLDRFEPDSPIKMGEHIGFKHDRTERP
jgi:phosphatidylserine decarboxylase